MSKRNKTWSGPVRFMDTRSVWKLSGLAIIRTPRIWWLVAFLVMSDGDLTGPCAAEHREVAASSDRLEALLSGGRRRVTLVHQPSLSTMSGQRPLVILLHGHGDSPQRVRRISGMDAKADREGFFVAYPSGTGWCGLPLLSWNAGGCCGYAMERGVDDVAFIRALIQQLLHRYPIDAHRIYVAGVSNGGMMAYRLGCELSESIAAIATVAGALTASACSPTHPLSVLIIHGTDDRQVRYDGGASLLSRDARVDPPVSRAVSFWVARNGCRVSPQRSTHGHIAQETYAGGREGTAVVLYTIQGGRHAWPGGRRGWWLGDAPTNEVSATDLIWEFFSQHPKS